MLTVVAAILFYVTFVLYVHNRRKQMQTQEAVVQRRRRQLRNR